MTTPNEDSARKLIDEAMKDVDNNKVISQEQIIRILDAFDRSMGELEALFKLLQQGVGMSLAPLKAALDDMKETLDIRSTADLAEEMIEGAEDASE